MNKKRIGIIFGGRSGEHEVSLLSAASVIRAMDQSRYTLIYIGITRQGAWKRFDGSPDAIEDGTWEKTASAMSPGDLPALIDFALPILHGPYGEDGKLQGLLEMLDIPYGGCGVLASALAMDKAAAKDVFLQNGLPVCRYVTVTAAGIAEDPEGILTLVTGSVGFPCFVKPANMGSSVGISKAQNAEDLRRSLALAAAYDRRILIEEAVDCREIETGVLGNRNPVAASVGEILSGGAFYDYQAKYTDGVSVNVVPADLPPDVTARVQELAIRAYQAIDGEGYARVDFFLEKNTGTLYLNEINTIPGFTKYSMFPLLWQAAGLRYDELLERIIELGHERHHDKDNRQTGI